MLYKLRDYIKTYHTASIDELAKYFQIDKDALIPMLTLWINKGVIRECRSCNKTCQGCRAQTTVFFEYC